MKKEITLTSDQIKILESVYPKLHSVLSKIEKVVAQDIVKELKDIQSNFKEVFTEYWEQDLKDSMSEMDQLEKVADANGLKSVWSISEVAATELDKKFNKTGVVAVVYKSWGPLQKIVLNNGKAKKVTWLEMWKVADDLIKLSGDNSHIFVEQFTEDKENPGVYHLFCGS